jgi:hypothetical protein
MDGVTASLHATPVLWSVNVDEQRGLDVVAGGLMKVSP